MSRPSRVSDFGQLAIIRGFVTPAQLDRCLMEQDEASKIGRTRPLGQLLIDHGFMTVEQVQEVLQLQKKRIFVCPDCQSMFNVRNFTASKQYRCRKCSSTLVSISDLDLTTTVVEPIEVDPHAQQQELHGAANLEIVAGARAGARVPIAQGQTIHIGAQPDLELPLPDAGISPIHCKVHSNGESILIFDYTGSGGTLVNARPIDFVTLLAGDEIRLGPVTIVVHVGGAAPSVRRPTVEPTPAPADSRTTALRADNLLGRQLIKLGLCEPSDINWALQEQDRRRKQGQTRRVADLLVERGVVSSDALQEILAEQQKHVLRCPRCGSAYNITSRDFGTHFKCANCGLMIDVPREASNRLVVGTPVEEGAAAAAPSAPAPPPKATKAPTPRPGPSPPPRRPPAAATDAPVNPEAETVLGLSTGSDESGAPILAPPPTPRPGTGRRTLPAPAPRTGTRRIEGEPGERSPTGKLPTPARKADARRPEDDAGERSGTGKLPGPAPARPLDRPAPAAGAVTRKQPLEETMVDVSRADVSPRPKTDPAGIPFGELAVKMRYVTRKQLDKCLRLQKEREARDGAAPLLGELLIEKRYLTQAQQQQILKTQGKRTFPIEIPGYQLIDKLGEGSTGSVFRALQRKTRRPVAIKLIRPQLSSDPRFERRFYRESEIAMKLDHPNIVAGIDAGKHSRFLYMVMAFVEGETTLSYIKREGRMSERYSMEIGYQMALALDYASTHQLIHRDIKPDNIILANDGTALLIDLGLAKEVGDQDSQMTRTGLILGTPNYISPEQAQGSRDIDHRADIYSLGAALYHLVTGELPFYHRSPMQTMLKHIKEDPLPPHKRAEEISRQYSLVIMKMMRKDPKQRYQSWAEFADEIGRMTET